MMHFVFVACGDNQWVDLDSVAALSEVNVPMPAKTLVILKSGQSIAITISAEDFLKQARSAANKVIR